MLSPKRVIPALVALSSWIAAAGGTARAAEPYVVGALGDSISAGFDARRLGDNRELSWSTGLAPEMNSHAHRLSNLRAGAVTVVNEAIAGSMVNDLERQVTRLLSKKPDYITLDIGANDVCSWASDYAAALANYETTLRDQITRIVAARPAVKIVLAPVPNMYNLWEVASPQPGCQARWDMVGICKPLLSSHLTTAERQAFVGRWEALNDAVGRVAADFPANVIHDASLANTNFEWSDVSLMDCFHPSVAGQNLLAEKSWEIVARALGY